MKVCGIIAEYNPFHNGHAYQIAAARKQGATHIVAVMSPNLVQRGTMSLLEKRTRAKAALLGGVDLVIELPSVYACATAERFAFGAVSLMNALGCVDELSFGSECGNIDLITKTAVAVHSPEILQDLHKHLRGGLTFASARQKAIQENFPPEIAAVLSTPNNTLGVEYVRHIINSGSSIRPVTIPRQGVIHGSTASHGSFASASYLQERIATEGLTDEVCSFFPPECAKLYYNVIRKGEGPCIIHRLDAAFLTVLRRLKPEDMARLPDISEGIGNRLYHAIQNSTHVTDVFNKTKTKRYTMARVRRLVLSAFFGIDGTLCTKAPPYLRILGMNPRGKEILSVAKNTATLPISQSLAKLRDMDGDCRQFAELEAMVTDAFTLTMPKVQPCGYDYTQMAIIL